MIFKFLTNPNHSVILQLVILLQTALESYGGEGVEELMRHHPEG